jgi:hypothetical protein
VTIEDFTVGANHHITVEQRGATQVTGAFVDAAHDRYLVAPRGLAQGRQVAALKIHRLIQQAGMQAFAEVPVPARFESPDPGRVTRDVGLREHDQFGPSGHGLIYKGDSSLQRCCTVQQDRGRLYDGQFAHVSFLI